MKQFDRPYFTSFDVSMTSHFTQICGTYDMVPIVHRVKYLVSTYAHREFTPIRVSVHEMELRNRT